MAGACLFAGALFAEDDEILVAIGKVAATPAMVKKATEDKTLDNMNVLIEGLEAVVGSELTENSPFTLMGGREGWAVYDSLYHKQQFDPADPIPDTVKFGMSLRVSGYDEQMRTKRVSGFVQAALQIKATVTVTILEAGSMKQGVSATVKVDKTVERNLAKESDTKEVSASAGALLQDLMVEIAQKAVKELVKNYYNSPGYVISVEDGEVTFDRGKEWCKVGDVLNLYAPAEEKTVKGRDKLKTETKIMVRGKKLGTVKVTEVFPGHARGTTTANESDLAEDCVVDKK